MCRHMYMYMYIIHTVHVVSNLGLCNIIICTIYIQNVHVHVGTLYTCMYMYSSGQKKVNESNGTCNGTTAQVLRKYS